jgi:uncharacterized protein (DUF433 family)
MSAIVKIDPAIMSHAPCLAGTRAFVEEAEDRMTASVTG